MTEKRRATVVKLLALSASSNDAEALSAVRKANAILTKEGTTWEKFLEPRTIEKIVVLDRGAGMVSGYHFTTSAGGMF